MKKHLLFTAIVPSAWARPYHTDDTTKGVPHAELRIYGFDTRITDKHGYFTVLVSKKKCDEYRIRGGIDLTIVVSPPKTVWCFSTRLTECSASPMSRENQKVFHIRVVKRGSLLLTRNEAVLYRILQKKIEQLPLVYYNKGLAWFEKVNTI
jgi:hypothetical protein